MTSTCPKSRTFLTGWTADTAEVSGKEAEGEQYKKEQVMSETVSNTVTTRLKSLDSGVTKSLP